MTAVGIDLVEIERVERALARRPRLADRLFTPLEREYADAHARPGRHLAARFAAKEAVAKALALEALVPREIEVTGPGRPDVRLYGRAAARARELDVAITVSLTHSRTDAAAVALAAPARR